MNGSLTVIGLGLVLSGLAAWWFVPTMAAPLLGLIAAAFGAVLVAVGSVRASRGRRQTNGASGDV